MADQKMPEIDHEDTQKEIVCPYCGNRQDDTDYLIDGNKVGRFNG